MMPVRGDDVARTYMMGLKRFIRPEFVVSVIGHLGGLLVLLFVGAGSIKSKLPNAMMVELVPPNEFARLQGPPVDATSSGVAASSNFNGPNATTQPQPPKPTAQQPQQPQQKSNRQRDGRQAPAPPETAKPDTAPPQMAEPLPAPTTPPQPDPEETPDGRGVGERFAMPLVLPGGQLGGGFNAPAIDAPKVGHDYTDLFLERVSSCSRLPPEIASNEDVRVALLVYLNPDGTLASPPLAIEPMFSPKAPSLMQAAINALQKCQPYTMLPKEKYKEWKTIPIVVTPINVRRR